MTESLFYLSAIILLIFLFLLLSALWPPDSPWSFRWRTSTSLCGKVARLGKITKKDIVYELGCGDGIFLINLLKQTGAKGIGIEIDPLRFLVSLMVKFFYGQSCNVKFFRSDFKKCALNDATVIYVYLVPNALARLMPKFEKELKTGTKIISYRYRIPAQMIDLSKKISFVSKDRDAPLFLYEVG